MATGLLGDNWDDPKTQGLMQFALAMMAGAGPHPVKRGVGAIAGEAGLHGIAGYNKQKLLLEELALRESQRKLREMTERKMQEEMDEPEQLAKFFSDPNNMLRVGKVRTEGEVPEGQMGPGDPVETLVASPLSQRELAYKMLVSGNRPAQKLGVASLLKEQQQQKPIVAGNVVLSPDGTQVLYEPKTTGVDRESEAERLIRKINDPATSPAELPYLRQRLQMLTTRAPNEQLAIKIEGQNAARGRVSENLDQLHSAYKALEAAGGAIKTGAGPVQNVTNYAMSTAPGQMVGKALGTETQQARNRIEQLRPLLIQEIRQATQMGAKGLDSNAELQFYLQAATDTTKDIDSNLAAIEVLDRAYGLGLGIASKKSARDKLRKEFVGSGEEGWSIKPKK